MPKITDGYSGKSKFVKGLGRKGSKSLDDYQKMLLESENGKFDNETKQAPLTKSELKAKGLISKPKSLNQKIRWK